MLLAVFGVAPAAGARQCDVTARNYMAWRKRDTLFFEAARFPISSTARSVQRNGRHASVNMAYTLVF